MSGNGSLYRHQLFRIVSPSGGIVHLTERSMLQYRTGSLDYLTSEPGRAPLFGSEGHRRFARWRVPDETLRESAWRAQPCRRAPYRRRPVSNDDRSTLPSACCGRMPSVGAGRSKLSRRSTFLASLAHPVAMLARHDHLTADLSATDRCERHCKAVLLATLGAVCLTWARRRSAASVVSDGASERRASAA